MCRVHSCALAVGLSLIFFFFREISPINYIIYYHRGPIADRGVRTGSFFGFFGEETVPLHNAGVLISVNFAGRRCWVCLDTLRPWTRCRLTRLSQLNSKFLVSRPVVQLVIHAKHLRMCGWLPGHDLDTLLFALLDEFLFRFSADDYLVCKEVRGAYVSL